MGKDKIARDFTKYVSLNILGMLGLSCYILADTFFVARALGQDGLAALNFCISFFSILQGVGLMLGIGGATRFAILKSGGEKARTNEVFTHVLALGLAAAVVFTVLGIFFAEPLARLLGADASTLPYSKVYLTTFLCFSPFFLLNNIMLAFIRNDDAPRLAMTAMLVSSASNIVLDYVFMFPLGWGMFGAAFATGLSPIISLCVLARHFVKKKNKFRPCRCKLRASELGRVSMLGFSALVGELCSAVALITFNLVILGIEGNTGVAAYGIVANIALIATAMFTGVAQGLQPLASSCFGSGDRAGIGRVIRYAVTTALVLSAVLYVVLFLGRAEVTAAFNRDGIPLLAALAERGIVLYFPGFVFAGINIVAAALLSAVAKPGAALLISILRSSVVLIPAVLVLSAVRGMDGVWLSFVVTELLVCALSAERLWRERTGLLQDAPLCDTIAKKDIREGI